METGTQKHLFLVAASSPLYDLCPKFRPLWYPEMAELPASHPEAAPEAVIKQQGTLDLSVNILSQDWLELVKDFSEINHSQENGTDHLWT